MVGLSDEGLVIEIPAFETLNGSLIYIIIIIIFIIIISK